MAGRYLRRFVCVDCGKVTERMWQAKRPLICVPCAQVRFQVATDAARAAVAEHTRQCRARLVAARQAAAERPGAAA